MRVFFLFRHSKHSHCVIFRRCRHFVSVDIYESRGVSPFYTERAKRG
nr:hypothetical protein WNSECMFO_WNSECMFO_CDS_0006 [Microvirus sp.]